MTVYREAGGGRRCDARCYDGKHGARCRCVCEGRNHGVGLEEAKRRSKRDVTDLPLFAEKGER